ncbi:MAG: metallophosphoesterase [Myxococcales bacterium]|nr:metallophosphoesterase [Myxococcales bacterium]
MRIASVSDLHIDFAENRHALVQLAAAIHEGQAELVIVAGDVSHVDEHISLTLRALKVAAPQVAYLPGNHDLWLSEGENNSWDRYRKTLPALVAAEGAYYLPTAPLILGSAAVVGTTGWYDYSLLRPEYTEVVVAEALRAKQWQGLRWSDDVHINFRDEYGGQMSDECVSRCMERELSEQLADVCSGTHVSHVIAVTHFLPFRESLGPSRGMPWDYFDAFMGSTSLGDVIVNCSKVRHVIYGHSHRPRACEVNGVVVRGTPLGYPRERQGIANELIAKRSIGWIDLSTDQAYSHLR